MGVPKLSHWDRVYASIVAKGVTHTMLDDNSVDNNNIVDGAVDYAALDTNTKRFTVNIRTTVDSLAADVWERTVFVAPFACKIISASIVTDSASGVDTNNATMSVQNKTQSQANASLQLTAANATTAYVKKSLGAITNATLAADDVITFKKSKNGNGLVYPEALLQLVIERAA